ncbi:MAG TPA: GDSL-type esterase/lipase family protein [Planctomycetota bacterium]|nr:GDSL-type esterase/lipase family protein [Planctomycetota bacterium]
MNTFCLPALIFGPLLLLTTADDRGLRAGDRLAIGGDPNPADRGYAAFIEDYLLLSQPVEGLQVTHGWCGFTGGPYRSHPDVNALPFQPTVVTTCFGWNEPADKPLDEQSATRYRTSQRDIVATLRKAGVRLIILGSPPCVDSASRNKSLSAVAEITKEVASQEGVVYADVFGTTLSAMTKSKARFGEGYRFEGNPSNLAMAHAFLKALGCDGEIGTLSLDFSSGKAEGTPGQKVLSFKDRALTVESTRIPIWQPGHSDLGDPDPVMSAFNADLNRFTLVVKNLPTARTKVYWPDEKHWCNFMSEDLARGVNLTVMRGPFARVFSDVDHAVRMQHDDQERAGAALLQGKPDPEAKAKYEAGLALARSRCQAVQHTLTLQPLSPPEKPPGGSIPVILDTDMNTDVDDVGALALLNSFMCQGEADLIACIANTVNAQQSSGAAIQAINAYYGHPKVPIGTYHGEPTPAGMASILLPAPPGAYHGKPGPNSSHFTLGLHRRFCPDFPNDDQLPPGVDLYRKALAAAKDGSVVIVSIGLLQNLQDLVQSQADSVSDLNGVDLVRKKVRLMVVMANTVPEDAFVLSRWPTRILWTTYVGTLIGAGQSLVDTPEDNPVREAYRLFGDEKHNALLDGRNTWDLDAAWIAVRGNEPLFDITPGYWRVNKPPAGYGTWVYDLTANQVLAVYSMPFPEVSKRFNAELARRPR